MCPNFVQWPLAALLTLAAPLTGCNAPSPAPIDPQTGERTAATFAKSFGDASNNSAKFAIPLSDGGYAVLGSWDGPVDDSDHFGERLWLAKLDGNGNTEWQSLLGDGLGPAHADRALYFAPMRRTPDGGYVLVGYVEHEFTDKDFLVIKLDASGEREWVRSYDSGPWRDYTYVPGQNGSDSLAAEDTATDVWPLPDGGFWVTGFSLGNVRTPRISFDSGDDLYSAAGGNVFYGARSTLVLRLDAAGNVLSQRRFTDDQFDARNESPLIRATSDGSALLVRVISDYDENSDKGHRANAVLTDRILSDGRVVQSGVYREDRKSASLGSPQEALQTDDPKGPDAPFDGIKDDGFAILFEIPGGDDLLLKLDRDLRLQYSYRAGGHFVFRSLVQYCDPIDRVCRLVLGGGSSTDDPFGVIDVLSPIGQPIARVPFGDWLDDVWALELRTDPATGAEVLRAAGQSPEAATTGRLVRIDPHTLTAIDGVAFAKLQPYNIHYRTFGSDGSFTLCWMDPQICDTYTPEGALERRFEPTPRHLNVRPRGIVEVTPDSFIIAADVTRRSSTVLHGVTVALVRVTRGKIDWQRFYDPNPGVEYFDLPVIGEVVASGDGGLVLSVRGPDFGQRLIEFSADGTLVWQSTFLDAQISRDIEGSSHLVRTGDGYAILTTGNYIARLDGSGRQLWAQLVHNDLLALENRFDSNDPNALLRSRTFTAIDADGDGLADDGFLIVNHTTRGSFTVTRVGADGALEWAWNYTFGLYERLRVQRVAQTADGGFVIGADDRLEAPDGMPTRSPGESNLALIKLDSAGRPLWTRVYGGLYGDYLADLRATADGGMLLASGSDSMGERREAWILRLGPDGLVAPGCNADLGTFGANDITTVTPANASVEPTDPGPPGDLPIEPLNDTPLVAQPLEVVVARQCFGSANPSLPMSPTATQFRLTVTRAGSPLGVVTSTPNGIVCGTGAGDFCSATFATGTRVELRAENNGSFLHWESPCAEGTGLSNPICVVTVDRNIDLTATYGPAPPVESFQLAVNVQGEGQVTAGGISCRVGSSQEDCTQSYAQGTFVNVTAAPDAGSHFVGWSGDCATFGTQPSVSLEMSGNKTCFAQFSPDAAGALISVRVTGSGVVRDDSGSAINCREGGTAEDCGETYTTTGIVRLIATPDAGQRFAGWGQDCAQFGTDASIELVTAQSQICTAQFDQPSAPGGVTLTVQLAGANADAHVDSQPAGIDCKNTGTTDCSQSYATGTEVMLRAQPAGKFASWQGCDEIVDVNFCRLTLSANRTVTATFNP